VHSGDILYIGLEGRNGTLDFPLNFIDISITRCSQDGIFDRSIYVQHMQVCVVPSIELFPLES